VIDARSVERLGALIEDAVRRGATVECGGRWDSSTRYVAPTILSGVRMDAEIMLDEIFGPVLPVADVLRIRTSYIASFIRAASRWRCTSSVVRARRSRSTLRNTSAGGSLVNNTLIHLANPNLPFGGVGGSGFGSYHGEFGFQAFSHARAVVRQGPFTVARMLYPPYGPHTDRLVKWLDRVSRGRSGNARRPRSTK
jgi:aldehyde dehydrogenase (NAD+)